MIELPQRSDASATRILLIIVAVIICHLIAWQTFSNAHPDEVVHIDAIQFFEQNWWPPHLNHDELLYSEYGWSRVYTGEIVYLIYGKLSALLYPHTTAWLEPYQLYRLFNVVLFASTLAVLFFNHCRWISLPAIGAVLCCIPQIYYLYGYANSDAFSLSVSLFLFVWVAKLLDRAPTTWSIRDYAVLGGLCGFVWLAKLPFLLIFGIVGALLVRHVIHSQVDWRSVGRGLLLAGLIVFCFGAPLKIVYPLSQGDFAGQVEQMRETQAIERLRPSLKLQPYEQFDFADPTTQWEWLAVSFKSFYALFGHLTVEVEPSRLYALPILLALSAFGLTVWTALRQWAQLPHQLTALWLVATPIIALNVVASFYNSYFVDYQPQGRYLLPSLIVFAGLLVGTYQLESGGIRRLHQLVFGLAYLLCVCVLIVFVVQHPTLAHQPVPEQAPARTEFVTVDQRITPHIKLARIYHIRHGDTLYVALNWSTTLQNFTELSGLTLFVQAVSADQARIAGVDLRLDWDVLHRGHYLTTFHQLDLPAGTAQDAVSALKIGFYRFRNSDDSAIQSLGQVTIVR